PVPELASQFGKVERRFGTRGLPEALVRRRSTPEHVENRVLDLGVGQVRQAAPRRHAAVALDGRLHRVVQSGLETLYPRIPIADLGCSAGARLMAFSALHLH